MPLNIFVYDICAESMRQAEQRWQESIGTSVKHKIVFQQTLECLPKLIDIAVIATTADVRPKLVIEVSSLSTVRYWVLEKVLAQSEEGLNQIRSFIPGDTNAWVNTPRRMMAWHILLKEQLGLTPPLTLRVKGGLWGLACNAVHFLDLLSWWSGETLQEINTDGLNSNWIESKRPGNMEICGTLVAKFSGGSQAFLTSDSGPADCDVHVSDEELSWKINETSGIAQRSDGISTTGRLEYQSEMSAGLLETILLTGCCKLPILAESVALHSVFIRSMQKHWVKAGNPSATLVPIT